MLAHVAIQILPAQFWDLQPGLELVGLEGIYNAKPPSMLRFHHYWACSEVEQSWAEQIATDRPGGGIWLPERRLHVERDRSGTKAGLPEYYSQARIEIGPGSVPDAVVYGEDEGYLGWCDAVEVELTAKRMAELKVKIWGLFRSTYRDVLANKSYGYDRVWFFVPSETLQRHVAAACEPLTAAQRAKVEIVVDEDLRPPTLQEE